MRTLRRPTSRRAGFTMVELAVSGVILSMMMGFLLLVQTTGQSAADWASLEDEADARLTRALERVGNELRGVIDATIWEDLPGAPAGSETITFQAIASLERLVRHLSEELDIPLGAVKGHGEVKATDRKSVV